MAFLRETLADVVTVHHGHMPEIELTSADDGHRHLGAAGHPQVAERRASCTGTATTTRPTSSTDDEWRIASTKLTRLHMDFTEPNA